VDSPLHWGQKYEPVSVMYYEHKYNTRVGDFGCIRHKTYSFLGASPDGINEDPLRPARLGRMLEIKNVVNRDMDGIPKKEYWIQMQLQMETCDLDECDFLETRFQEYADETAFLEDGSSFLTTGNGKWKGVFLFFSTSEGRPYYVYKPLCMGSTEYETWSTVQMEENESKGKTWVRTIFWKLEEVSCVLVERNRRWFEANVGHLESLWATIERERVTGYDHRAPQRRTIKTNHESSGQGCLIDVKGRIRSESFS
jgi:hypothetical protein